MSMASSSWPMWRKDKCRGERETKLVKRDERGRERRRKSKSNGVPKNYNHVPLRKMRT
jgi:hypothetical protein